MAAPAAACRTGRGWRSKPSQQLPRRQVREPGRHPRQAAQQAPPRQFSCSWSRPRRRAFPLQRQRATPPTLAPFHAGQAAAAGCSGAPASAELLASNSGGTLPAEGAAASRLVSSGSLQVCASTPSQQPAAAGSVARLQSAVPSTIPHALLAADETGVPGPVHGQEPTAAGRPQPAFPPLPPSVGLQDNLSGDCVLEAQLQRLGDPVPTGGCWRAACNGGCRKRAADCAALPPRSSCKRCVHAAQQGALDGRLASCKGKRGGKSLCHLQQVHIERR